jgi:hypothetical protein
MKKAVWGGIVTAPAVMSFAAPFVFTLITP